MLRLNPHVSNTAALLRIYDMNNSSNVLAVTKCSLFVCVQNLFNGSGLVGPFHLVI